MFQENVEESSDKSSPLPKVKALFLKALSIKVGFRF